MIGDWEFKRPEGLPLPQPAEEARPFWEALRRGELRLQRCAQCRRLLHPPAALCPDCHSFEFEWEPASGLGTVYSYVVTRQAIHPALLDHTPFATVQVELEEGPIMVSNLIDVPPDEIQIGMRVRAVMEPINDEVTLPYFRVAH